MRAHAFPGDALLGRRLPVVLVDVVVYSDQLCVLRVKE